MHLIDQFMVKTEGLKKVFRSGKSDLVLFENLSFQVCAGLEQVPCQSSPAGSCSLSGMTCSL